MSAATWPYRLSTVLSVVTGKLLAEPADIASLLVWMTGNPTIRFDPAAARTAAPRCAQDLRRQFPALNADLSFPALPATADTDTIDGDRPAQLDDWIAKVADILGYSHRDPWLPIRPLPEVG